MHRKSLELQRIGIEPQGPERNRWLVETATKLLTGRKVVIVNIYTDDRIPTLDGPFTVQKVNNYGNPEDGKISVITEYGTHCSNRISHFSMHDHTLHTLADARHPIHRIFKVIVPSREAPEDTDRRDSDDWHALWSEACYEGPKVSSSVAV